MSCVYKSKTEGENAGDLKRKDYDLQPMSSCRVPIQTPDMLLMALG